MSSSVHIASTMRFCILFTSVSTDQCDLCSHPLIFYLVTRQPEFFRSLALRSSVILRGMLARSFTQTQIWHVGLEYVWAPNSRSILQTTAGSTKVGDFVGILETWVTIALPGLTNSNTVSTTSPAPPSYARRPDLSFARTLSLSPISQLLLLARSTLENK